MMNLVKENLNNINMYGILEIDPDNILVHFYIDQNSAQTAFIAIENGVLFKINGPGSVGVDITAFANGNIIILAEKQDGEVYENTDDDTEDVEDYYEEGPEGVEDFEDED